ncbi:MAG: phosphatidylserine decarboxylase [Firmicutes bacterium]|nr:phosphatidylserine decarboxylase [Bacillota bacterium]
MELKRETVDINAINEPASLKFLYENAFGRILLKVATFPVFSIIAGAFLDSNLSKRFVKGFAEKNHIDMHDYSRVRNYESFNEFFTRRVREGVRPIDENAGALISPCDGKLTAFHIDEDRVFEIKRSRYNTADLLKDEKLAEEYSGGTALIFRLTVDDYHRYCYIDNGRKGDNIHIRGRLHTVQPIALRNAPVFVQNSREYTVMDTENFGRVIQIEVGALMVGKIKNHQRVCEMKKGREKGMFLFGGSTIILLLKEGAAEIDQEIFDNTENDLETVVKMGEKIGEAGNRRQ